MISTASFVDSFQLRLALQNDGCRDFPAADGGDLVEGESAQCWRTRPESAVHGQAVGTVFIIRTVTQQVDKLALKHGKNSKLKVVSVSLIIRNNTVFSSRWCPAPFIVLHRSRTGCQTGLNGHRSLSGWRNGSCLPPTARTLYCRTAKWSGSFCSAAQT